MWACRPALFKLADSDVLHGRVLYEFVFEVVIVEVAKCFPAPHPFTAPCLVVYRCLYVRIRFLLFDSGGSESFPSFRDAFELWGSMTSSADFFPLVPFWCNRCSSRRAYIGGKIGNHFPSGFLPAFPFFHFILSLVVDAVPTFYGAISQWSFFFLHPLVVFLSSSPPFVLVPQIRYSSSPPR